jgi:16S rRNA (adenine1518-N6/adenine1519-N6)-dimethyltransferase
MSNSRLHALDIPALLRQYGLRPSKGLGQNFLQDEQALQKIVEIADIQQDDTVLEIGPGLGGLTRHLARRAAQVIAVELDEDLFAPLQAILAPYPNVQLIHGDILKLQPSELVAASNYLVVANIPYYITSALLRHLLAQPVTEKSTPKNQQSAISNPQSAISNPQSAISNPQSAILNPQSAPRPRRLVLTVQEGVAERICAAPGELSLLALSVQVYGKPVIAARIPAAAFYPAPNVNSAVVAIDVYAQSIIPYPRLETFFRLAKAGFGQKRKTLRNALSAIMPRDKAEQLLLSAGIDPMRRAETLSLHEWAKLSEP